MLTVQELSKNYHQIFTHRDTRLFTEFLVRGYRSTTLPSVAPAFFDDVIYAKVCLGMIITLYDDLADNPAYYRPQLLKTLYQFNLFERPLEQHDPVCHLANLLFSELENSLGQLPLAKDYFTILSFDIRHIFLANQYAELMTAEPRLRNLTEARMLGPYNMGMVAAGMIDLMASPAFSKSALGRTREVLMTGQRIGRIANMLTTFEREQREGDVTSEMHLHPTGVNSARAVLLAELHSKLARLQHSDGHYAEGLAQLFRLHTQLEGVI